MQAVKLICPENGRFHFGLVGLDENSSLYQTSEIIHSDTLFSAIVTLYAQTFGKVITDDLVKAFKADEIRISSAYHYLNVSKVFWQKNEQGKREKKLNKLGDIYFFPKPVTAGLKVKNTLDRKNVNGISYVSKGILERGIRAEKTDEEGNYWEGEGISLGKKFLIQKDELFDKLEEYLTKEKKLLEKLIEKIKQVYKEKTSPKIADHARKKQDNIYFQKDLFLQSTYINRARLQKLAMKADDPILIQPHFYFLLDTDWDKESEAYKRLMFILREILPDEGIGGGISTGCGQVLACEVEDFSLDIPESEHQMTLSLTAPLANDNIHFGKTILRGGRVLGDRSKAEDAQERLKMVRMLQEGAIVSADTKGDIPKLHDNRDYYRYGKAFSIPLHPNYVIHA
ncbi:MAG: hypothetical protein AAGG68_30185 [Bacteroidota bacterium]